MTADQHTVPPAPPFTRQALGAKGLLGILLAVFAVSRPYTLDPFQVEQLITVMSVAIAAMGLNLLTGFGGQISIGHGAFYGVGAYTTAILVQDHGWPHLLTIPVAMVLTFVIGILVGLPALRIKGLYLALVTLAVATLFPEIVKKFPDVTGGSTGIVVTTPLEGPESLGLEGDQFRFFVALVLLVVVFVAVRNLVRSRTGRALIAIRDNETAAEVLGVDLSVAKVLTFGISACLAGLGGAMSMMAKTVNIAAPNQYSINLSIILLVVVVVGGTATIMGPLIGAYIVTFLPDWIPEDANDALTPLIFGASLILLMMVAPGGILGLTRKLWATVSPKIRGGRGPTRAAPADPLASAAS